MHSSQHIIDPWLGTAIARIEADYQSCADTHLIALPLTSFAAGGIDFYLKDQSTHPTGNLKHRPARPPILVGCCANAQRPVDQLMQL